MKIPGEFNTSYSVELFHKIDSNHLVSNLPKVEKYITMIDLDSAKLMVLDEDNFKTNSGLDFDIRNKSQLRQFVSGLYSMKARIRDLPLMSFDNQDSLSCQLWNFDISFDFMERTTAWVSKYAEYRSLKCKPDWKDQVNYEEEENDVNTDLSVGCSKHSGNLLLQYTLLVGQYRGFQVQHEKIHQDSAISLPQR